MVNSIPADLRLLYSTWLPQYGRSEHMKLLLRAAEYIEELEREVATIDDRLDEAYYNA